MAGKKKASKKVAAKKSPAKKKRAKRLNADAVARAQVIDFEAKMEEERERERKDIEENPFAYRVMCFLNDGVFPLDDFKTLEDAQHCVDAQSQVNDIKWSIIIEKRPARASRGTRDGW